MLNLNLGYQIAIGAALSLMVGGAPAMATSTAVERSSSRSHAQIANIDSGEALIMNFGGPSRWLQVKTNGNPGTLMREIDERNDINLPIAHGGWLSVNNKASWASFSFRGLGGNYNGLFIKTDGEGSYKFRCDIDGDFIISWSPEPDGPCETNDGRHILTINQFGNAISDGPDLKKPIAIATSAFSTRTKQLAQAAAPFPDISGSIYQAEIERAYSLGFTAGDTPNENGVRLFRPNDYLSREEAVSFILEAIGVPDNELNGRSSFPDVYDSDWSDGKIAYAERNNIVSGFQDGTFAPNSRRDPRGLVTRAQLMAMLKGVSSPPFFTGLTVGDATIFSDTAGHWASSTITDMSSYCGIASSLNEQGSNFAPDLPATRAFTAAAIVRLYDCAQTIVENPPAPGTPSVTAPSTPVTEAPRIDEERSDGLNLELGDELTLVRTDKGLNTNTFEVFQGSVRITSEDFPTGKTVRQGQKITINNGDIASAKPEPINNFAVEATSCSVLQALNPDYVLSQETRPSLRNDIMQQIERHKSSLGLPLVNRPANLSILERRIIDEINLARESPSGYATLLTEYWQELQESGQDIILPDGRISNPSDPALFAAYTKALEFLNSSSIKLQRLATSEGMSKAAEEWVSAQANSNQLLAPNNTQNRLSNYGTISCRESNVTNDENIFYGSNLTPGKIMFDFIVGDFLVNADRPDMDQRSSLFNKDYQVAGVACDSFQQHGTVCSIIFTAGYREHNTQR